MTNRTGFPDTQVFMYTCTHCDTVERIAYTAEIEEDAHQSCGQIFTGWYRVEDGQNIYWNADVACPTCHRNRKSGNLKVTIKAKHTCDDACKNAKGDKCICSCGGKHHGEKYAHPSQLSLF